MEQNSIDKLELSIKNLQEKKVRIYIFTQDTKGNPKASIRYQYQLALALKEKGYNPIMLHEKADYTGVSQWLGDNYMKEIPHRAIENEKLEVAPEDILIIPEIFGFVLEQVKDLPCAKIVLCQSYSYMLDTLQPGYGWANFGFFKCITTSEYQKEYISTVMRNISIDVLPPVIPDVFTKSKYPQKPIVAVHSREQSKTINFIKTFYLKFPQYRWVTFRDMRGLNQDDFAGFLKDCFLSVWIDDISAYGTYPLESIKSGVPVLGISPNMIPSWMNEENGIWVNEEIRLPDYTADFIQNWLEDNIKPELYEKMEETSSNLPTIEDFSENVDKLFSDYLSVRELSFQEQLNKIK